MPDCSKPILVLACDQGYAMPLATALRSIADTNRASWPLEIHVLTERFSSSMRAKVLGSLPGGSASLRWIQVDLDAYRDFSTIAHISRMTYARFLIPKLFPDAVSRVLYLDADILVLHDLIPLWETELSNAAVGAVADEGLDALLKQGDPRVSGMPQVRDYFNAGILLIDLDRWREERISEKAIDYLHRHPDSPFSDQDALNLACDGLWQKLDGQWNYQGHLKNAIAKMRAEERPRIVHFVTDAKPWDARASSLNAAFYDGYRARTCFARTTYDSLYDAGQVAWARIKGYAKGFEGIRLAWSLVSSRSATRR